MTIEFAVFQLLISFVLMQIESSVTKKKRYPTLSVKYIVIKIDENLDHHNASSIGALKLNRTNAKYWKHGNMLCIVFIGVSTPPSKTPPCSFLPSPPPPQICNCPTPPPPPFFRQSTPIYWFFVRTPSKSWIFQLSVFQIFIVFHP